LVHDLWERISEDREEVAAMRAGRGAIGSGAIALSFMAMLMLSACTSGTSSELSPSPTLSTTTAPPSPATIARQEALAAYRAMWEDMATAAKTADYRSPLLAQHAAGAALSILVRGLYTDKRTGIVVKGQPVTNARVVSLSPPANPTKASIVDCFDDRHWLNYKVSGGLQNSVPGGLHHTTATVSDINGVWKVTQLHVEASGTCQGGSSPS
jgi:hypothetical protein